MKNLRDVEKYLLQFSDLRQRSVQVGGADRELAKFRRAAEEEERRRRQKEEAEEQKNLLLKSAHTKMGLGVALSPEEVNVLRERSDQRFKRTIFMKMPGVERPSPSGWNCSISSRRADASSDQDVVVMSYPSDLGAMSWPLQVEKVTAPSGIEFTATLLSASGVRRTAGSRPTYKLKVYDDEEAEETLEKLSDRLPKILLVEAFSQVRRLTAEGKLDEKDREIFTTVLTNIALCLDKGVQRCEYSILASIVGSIPLMRQKLGTQKLMLLDSTTPEQWEADKVMIEVVLHLFETRMRVSHDYYTTTDQGRAMFVGVAPTAQTVPVLRPKLTAKLVKARTTRQRKIDGKRNLALISLEQRFEELMAYPDGYFELDAIDRVAVKQLFLGCSERRGGLRKKRKSRKSQKGGKRKSKRKSRKSQKGRKRKSRKSQKGGKRKSKRKARKARKAKKVALTDHELVPLGEIVTVNQVSPNEEKIEDVHILLFHANWCGHCKTFMPEWRKFKKNNDDNYKITMHEGDEPGTKVLSSKYGVEGFPTIVVKRNGKHQHYSGDRTSVALENFVKNLQ